MLVKLVESEKTLVRTTRAVAIKGIVHPKIKSDHKYILSLFTHPHVIPYDFFLFHAKKVVGHSQMDKIDK